MGHLLDGSYCVEGQLKSKVDFMMMEEKKKIKRKRRARKRKVKKYKREEKRVKVKESKRERERKRWMKKQLDDFRTFGTDDCCSFF